MSCSVLQEVGGHLVGRIIAVVRIEHNRFTIQLHTDGGTGRVEVQQHAAGIPALQGDHQFLTEGKRIGQHLVDVHRCIADALQFVRDLRRVLADDIGVNISPAVIDLDVAVLIGLIFLDRLFSLLRGFFGSLAGSFLLSSLGSFFLGGLAGSFFFGGLAGSLFLGGLAGSLFLGGLAGSFLFGSFTGCFFLCRLAGCFFFGCLTSSFFLGSLAGGFFFSSLAGGFFLGSHAGSFFFRSDPRGFAVSVLLNAFVRHRRFIRFICEGHRNAGDQQRDHAQNGENLLIQFRHDPYPSSHRLGVAYRFRSPNPLPLHSSYIPGDSEVFNHFKMGIQIHGNHTIKKTGLQALQAFPLSHKRNELIFPLFPCIIRLSASFLFVTEAVSFIFRM